ncbi:hypothetical protein J4558_25435 [Leptolyngbya sp. 15MV]|nr:hypothetical protein J4558_25435 [Leptolyngbya sp. 15MV]
MVPSLEDVGGHSGHADVVEHGAQSQADDVAGAVGGEASALDDDVVVELEAHEDGEHADGGGVAEERLIVVGEFLEEGGGAREEQEAVDELGDGVAVEVVLELGARA